MLTDLGQKNFLELDYQCNIPNHSGPVWDLIFPCCKTSTGFAASRTTNLSSIQEPCCWLEALYYFVVNPCCLWFPKKLWSKIPPFNFIITKINLSWCIICWVLFWTDIMPMGFILMTFGEFNSACHKYFEPFLFIPNVSQYNLPISPEYFFIDSNFFFKRIDIFTESVAATNSILGMVITFNGATQALPIIRLQRILPLSSTKRK